MSFKKIVPVATILAATMFLICGEEDPVPPVVTPDPVEKSYGTFRVRLVAEDLQTDNPAYTAVEGTVNDGPAVPDVIFQKIEEVGCCKLYKALSPFCEPKCGGSGKCIAENTCQPYPNAFSVGKVTVTGMKYNGAKTTFTMDPSNAYYYQLVGTPLDYPPFSEGDSLTFSAAGTSTAAAFTLQTRGITPLVISNEDIVVEEGKPITFRWEKPKVAGVSTMSIRINISYHGGTKGEILCDCEDNGELTVPASMLSKLKSYGFAGWPIADMTRRSIVSADSTKPKLILESMVTKGLKIPGVVSCNENEECPSGNCKDRMCQ